MPISREELVARSLLHANSITGGSLTLPAMLDNNQFNQLSPEEKAGVVERYATLSRNHPASHQVPSLGSTIAQGARNGLIGSVLPTALAGVIAVPTIAAISASMGNRTAMVEIMKRTAAPLALAAGIGMTSGIVGSVLGRAMTSDNNRYIQDLVSSVHKEEDPDTRRVRAMALVAASPALNRRAVATENIGHNMSQQLIGRFLGGGETQEMFQSIIPADNLQLPDGSVQRFPYNDFRFVGGLGQLTTDRSTTPAFKIVPNSEVH